MALSYSTNTIAGRRSPGTRRRNRSPPRVMYHVACATVHHLIWNVRSRRSSTSTPLVTIHRFRTTNSFVAGFLPHFLLPLSTGSPNEHMLFWQPVFWPRISSLRAERGVALVKVWNLLKTTYKVSDFIGWQRDGSLEL